MNMSWYPHGTSRQRALRGNSKRWYIKLRSDLVMYMDLLPHENGWACLHQHVSHVANV